MNLWYNTCWRYRTKLRAQDCIKCICCLPQSFGANPFNPHYYDCELISDSKLKLIFKGTRFGKLLRTEYIASFHEAEDHCLIEMQFQRELFGLPAMTSTYQLDMFFEEKVQAHRDNSF